MNKAINTITLVTITMTERCHVICLDLGYLNYTIPVVGTKTVGTILPFNYLKIKI